MTATADMDKLSKTTWLSLCEIFTLFMSCLLVLLIIIALFKGSTAWVVTTLVILCLQHLSLAFIFYKLSKVY